MKQTWHQLAALIVGVLVVASGCAQGAVGDQVQMNAILNGDDLAATSPNKPVRISDDQTAELTLSLTNVSNEPITVRYVRFEGEVIDMIFLTYDTALSVPLAPGESRTLPPVLLDFFDLGGQARGYLRGTVQLYDENRDAIGSQPMFLDASGDGMSTLELFNLLLLAATVVGMAWNLLRLAQRRLPTNRFVRALRFLAVGAGAGLTLAVAFSTLRIWPLRTLWWVLFTVVGAVIGYAIGLLLPGSEGDDIDLLDEEDLLEELVLEHDDLLVGASTATAGTTAAAAGSTTAARKTVIDARGEKPEAALDRAKGDRAKEDRAKETVTEMPHGAGGAKKTVAQAPGVGAKETVAKAKPAAKAAKAKETVVKASPADTSRSKAKETLARDADTD